MNRLQEIETRKQAIGVILTSGAECDLNALETELRALNDEKALIEKRKALADSILSGSGNPTPIPAPGTEQRSDFYDTLASKEYRNAFFKSFSGRQMQAEERKAFDFVSAEVEKRTAQFMTTDTNSAGKAVPTITLNLIKANWEQTLALYPYIDKNFIPGNVFIPVASDLADASWNHVQGTNVDSEKIDIGGVNLGGYELVKIISMSKAVNAMSIDALEAFVVSKLSDKMGKAIENAIINGLGAAASPPEPTGILVGITFSLGNNNLVEYPASGMTYATMTASKGKLKQGYKRNAKYTMSTATLWNQVASIMTADGEPIFILDPTGDFVGRILGSPVVENDFLPDGVIVYGDFMQYSMNISQDVMIEKSLESSFKANLIDYKGTLVGDSKPVLAKAFVKIALKA
jgi:HK97 family phage major capsid protein